MNEADSSNEIRENFVVPNQPSSKPVNNQHDAQSDSGLTCNKRDKESSHFKKRKKDTKENADLDSTSDEEMDTSSTQPTKNPIDLIARWPSLGQGKHSVWTRTYHEWFHSIASELALLKFSKESVLKKVKALENQNKQKDAEIASLKSKVTELEKQVQTTSISGSPTTPTMFSWSDLVAGNKKTETVNAMLAVVKSELKKEDRLMNNIVISGLSESTGENAQIEEDEKVQKLLDELEIEFSVVKRKTRLRKRGKEVDPNKPSLLLIELHEQKAADKAIANAKKLAKSTHFKKVYINRDKTEADRAAEANLRKERNEKNRTLPFAIDESRGLRYGVDKNTNKKFYWSIRSGELAKVFILEGNTGPSSEISSKISS